MKAQKISANLPSLTGQQRCKAKSSQQAEPQKNGLAAFQMRLMTYRNDQIPQNRIETLQSQVDMGIYHIDSTAMAQQMLKLSITRPRCKATWTF